MGSLTLFPPAHLLALHCITKEGKNNLITFKSLDLKVARRVTHEYYLCFYHHDLLTGKNQAEKSMQEKKIIKIKKKRLMKVLASCT